MLSNDVSERSKNAPPRPALRDGRGEGMMCLIKWLDKNKKSLSWLADQVDRSRQAVSAWDEIPDKCVKKITLATGIPAHKLRPDMFPEKSEKKDD